VLKSGAKHIRYSAEQDDPWLRHATVAVVDEE
jgi:hypothetical protein